MYQINDVIVYENGGVCKIADIGVPDFVTTEERYYKLQPICDNGGTIYVKLNSNKVFMRSVITKEEAENYLSEVDELEEIYSSNDKLRDREFQEAIKSCEFKRCLQVVKGITMERNRRNKTGKKLNMSDDRNLQRAGKLIAAECSVIFDISIEQAKMKIQAAMGVEE